MADYITLLGAEQVNSAAGRMASAANEMQQAASSIDSSVDRLIRALENHAERIEAVLQESQPNG